MSNIPTDIVCHKCHECKDVCECYKAPPKITCCEDCGFHPCCCTSVGWDKQRGSIIRVEGDISATNHPPHYNQGKFECWDVIVDLGLGFDLGNALKYIWRASRKGNAREDIKKAIQYLNHYLEVTSD